MVLTDGMIIYYLVLLAVLTALAYKFGYKTGKLESESEDDE
jgi:hypothetical protein